MIKSQSEVVVKQFETELEQAANARNTAETLLKSAALRLGEKKNELNYWISKSGTNIFTNQENIELTPAVPKDFLASEKLASAKKQISLSPIKPKKPRKRNSSFSKNK